MKERSTKKSSNVKSLHVNEENSNEAPAMVEWTDCVGHRGREVRKNLVVSSLLAVSIGNGATAGLCQEQFAKSTCEAVSRREAGKEHPEKAKGMLTPDSCWKHVGQCVSVRFLVDNTHACRKGHVYLNESKDYKKCFAAIISASSRKRFPAEAELAYKGRMIVVTGTLEMFGGAPKIVLAKPEQIRIVE